MRTARPFRLGVLGGIGPEATGIFYLRLIRRLQEEKLIQRNEDYPQVIINSIPAPELVFEQFNEKDIDPYHNGLKELDAIGVDAIIMICNTIHLFYSQLQERIQTPIIDLQKAVEQAVRKRQAKTVAIVGTPHTVGQGLYRFDGVRTLQPTLEECAILGAMVFNFNRGFEVDLSKAMAIEIIEAQLRKGAALVILGCTELAVMLEGTNLPVLDTIDVMVESVIQKYREQMR